MTRCVFHSLFLFLLLLMMNISCNISFSNFIFQDTSGRESILERQYYDDEEEESFVGLMGKRDSGLTAAPPPKQDVTDVFIGLFGRRNAELDLAAERRDGRGRVFRQNRRLRF